MQTQDPQAYDRAPRLIDVGEGEYLAMQVFGSGPTVVLQPSGVGVGINAWGEFPEKLAEHATVVVYDRLGAGLSHSGRDRYATPTEHAHHLARALRLLPVRLPAVHIGWSMGGLMAQQYAALYPQDVAALLLMDPTIFIHAQMAQPPKLPEGAKDLKAEFQAQMKAAIQTPEGRRRFLQSAVAMVGPRYPIAKAEALFMQTPGWRHAENYLAASLLEKHKESMAAEVARTITERGLPKIPIKLLLSTYHGKNTPPEWVEVMKRQWESYLQTAAERGIPVQQLEGISHQIPLEAPDECTAATLEYLALG